MDLKSLLKNFQHYGIKVKKLSRFDSYLTGQKQYISFEINDTNAKIEQLDKICGVPKGLILGLLLFIIYISDVFQVFNILNPIMFADDINLFCLSIDIKILF